MESVGIINPINLEYVFYSMFAEREVKVFRYGPNSPDFYFII